MIIPREKGPGNDIDIYLQSLIEELKQLWSGVETYDVLRKENFNLRAALLWTINNFPAYANLSGWSTKGRYACPLGKEKKEERGKREKGEKGRKELRQGGTVRPSAGRRTVTGAGRRTRRPERYTAVEVTLGQVAEAWGAGAESEGRWDRCGGQGKWGGFQRTLFNGTKEYRGAPEQTIGSEILFMLKDINFSYGKMNQPPNTQTKRSLKDESDDESDEEDDPNELPYGEHNILRRNLDVMHIEKNVYDNIIGTILNVDGKSKDNFQSRLDLVDMRIRRDLHPQVLLNGKYRLSPSIFSMSKEEKEVFCMVLKDIKVSDAYASIISRCVSLKDRRLYSLKSHDYHILMQDLLSVALRCCMSKNVRSCIIELSNIMKAICGKVLDVKELEKVQDRAALTLCNLEKIFPPPFFTIMMHLVIHLPHKAILGGPIFYRWMFLSKLKSYCRNKRYPEGSIAEDYLPEECMTFCSRYLEDVETRLNRPSRNVWSGNDVNDEVKWLSQGPNRVIKRYSAFFINGYRFHTKYRERMRRTQNCGIVVNSSITSYASTRDSNSVEGNVEYYRLLTDIIELDYCGRWKVVLFRCDWADVNTARGIKKDQFGKMRRRRLRDLSIVQNTSNSEEANSEQQTVVGSSNVPETLDKPGEFQSNSRGRTLLKDLYDLNPVERVKVSRNSHGQPVGSEARLLAGYLSILARNANMLPIKYESWHQMPDSNKNQALDNIKLKSKEGRNQIGEKRKQSSSLSVTVQIYPRLYAGNISGLEVHRLRAGNISGPKSPTGLVLVTRLRF
ncbi:hypothetical protein CXB51_002268 [Gossypium anomalum]|uniref:DUF4218 domain-containing protein n=1 Tax=Gossypium anomalum TaxID=47600 RepID=A0A8J6DDM5_9ROSI|nr:hypothetical protein CXB51_002268 [Gossypium anomalum]